MVPEGLNIYYLDLYGKKKPLPTCGIGIKHIGYEPTAYFQISALPLLCHFGYLAIKWERDYLWVVVRSEFDNPSKC